MKNINLKTINVYHLKNWTLSQQFFGEVHERDGNEYEPSSLAVMQGAIDR